MDIIAWLDREHINWFPIKLDLTNGKKTPMAIFLPEYAQRTDRYPTTNDFANLDKTALQARKDLYHRDPSKWKHIAIDTRFVHHVDLDTPDIEEVVVDMRKNMPCFKSTTKSYGAHIFIKADDGWTPDKPIIKPYIQKDVELLCGQWSFAPSTAVVENHDINYSFPNIGSKRMDKQKGTVKNPSLPPLPSTDLPLLEKIVGLIDLRYCREFDSWHRIVCALHNSGFTEEFAKAWSMQAPNYDDQGFYQWWGRDYSSITEGTLRYYARLSNEQGYKSIVSSAFKSKDFSDYALAKLFLDLDDNKSVTVGDTTYRYEGKLWAVDHKQSKLHMAVCDTLRKFYTDRKRSNATVERSDSEEKAENLFMTDLFKKVTSAKGTRDILTMLKPMIHRDDIMFDTDPKHDNHISFFNGVFDLDQGTLREHVKEDYLTVCLDWSYAECTCIDSVRDILKQIQPAILPTDKEGKKIPRPEGDTPKAIEEAIKWEETRDKQHILQMTWLASCLRAGNNGFFKINYGRTARNGKTTEMNIFRDCFPCYSAEVPNTLFEKGNAKVHKFMHGLLTKPIRAAFMEEMKANKQDSDLLKRFVDGGIMEQEQMYGTTMKGRLTAKLSVSTNHEMRTDVDAGIMRRGVQQEYTSRFIDYAEDVDEDAHIYAAKDVRAIFQQDCMKRQFFAYLLNFDVTNLPTLVKAGQEEFAEMIQGTDPMYALIEEQIAITENDDDCITRKELGELATEKQWMELKGALQARGCIWDKTARNGKGEKRGKIFRAKIVEGEDE